MQIVIQVVSPSSCFVHSKAETLSKYVAILSSTGKVETLRNIIKTEVVNFYNLCQWFPIFTKIQFSVPWVINIFAIKLWMGSNNLSMPDQWSVTPNLQIIPLHKWRMLSQDDDAQVHEGDGVPSPSQKRNCFAPIWPQNPSTPSKFTLLL